MSTIFIKTDRLSLYTLEEDLVTLKYTSWFNDDRVCMYNSHRRFPYLLSENSAYVKSLVDNRNNIVLAIVETKTNKHIGNISLQNINFIDRSAEIAFIIGDFEAWGKGYATEAGKALISHAFAQLNLHRIYLGTSDDNIGMQSVATKLGFKKEGVRVDAIYNNGTYHSIIEYGLIRDKDKNYSKKLIYREN